MGQFQLEFVWFQDLQYLLLNAKNKEKVKRPKYEMINSTIPPRIDFLGEEELHIASPQYFFDFWPVSGLVRLDKWPSQNRSSG